MQWQKWSEAGHLVRALRRACNVSAYFTREMREGAVIEKGGKISMCPDVTLYKEWRKQN